MDNLAVAANVHWMSGEEGESMLLKARGGGHELLRQSSSQALYGCTKAVISVQGAVLIELALRRQAGDVGSRTGTVREGPLMKNTLRRKLVGVSRRRAEGVPEGEESVPGKSGVAGGGWRCAARAEFQEVEIVVADQEDNRDPYYQGFE